MASPTTVVGNIVRDLEVQDGGGTPVVNGTVAEDHGYGTNFIPFVVWGSAAENMAEYFSKGDGVILSGNLETNEYQTSDGEDRSELRLRVGTWSFPPGGRSQDDDGDDSAEYEDDAPF